MQYNQFGTTGLVVSELCLGTMTFGQGPGRFSEIAGLDLAQSTALVRQAIDAGINIIDTANVYTQGESEALTGAALRTLGIARDEIIVATKAMGAMGETANAGGISRQHLMAQIDASLSRLQMDYVDLYQIHGWDPLTPMEEALRALDDIVRSGRARYIGVSNWAAWQIAKALGISARLNLNSFVSDQAYYSLVGRELEREIVPMLQSEGLGLMVWSPLAGGFLSGKYDRANGGEGRRAKFEFPPIQMEQGFKVIDGLRPIADRHGASVAQIALSWLLHQPAVSTVIIGAKRADQLADNIGACAVTLTQQDMAEIDALTALTPEYPQWMFAVQGGQRAGAVSPRRSPA